MSKSSWDRIKHKTYDTSKGFGDESSWKQAFNERLSNKTEGVKEKSILAQCSNIKELNKTFKAMIKELHPDIAGDTEENKIATQKLIEEFSELRKAMKKQ